MMLSDCPKPNKNILLVSAALNKPDLREVLHKKAVVIDFYNSQRCGVHIINQLLHDYNCQPTCDNWVL